MNKVRLIDANALKEAFDKWWGCDDIPTTIVEDLIDDAPTLTTKQIDNSTYLSIYNEGYLAGLKERTKKSQGEWIDYDNTFYKCPDCGYLLEKCCPQCQNKVILPKGGAE